MILPLSNDRLAHHTTGLHATNTQPFRWGGLPSQKNRKASCRGRACSSGSSVPIALHAVLYPSRPSAATIVSRSLVFRPSSSACFQLPSASSEPSVPGNKYESKESSPVAVSLSCSFALDHYFSANWSSLSRSSASSMYLIVCVIKVA